MQNKHYSASHARMQHQKTQNTKPFNRIAQGYAWDSDNELKERTIKRNFDFRRLSLGLPILAGIAILGISLKNSFATTTYTARQDSGSYILADADYDSEEVESLYDLSSTTIPTSFSLANTLNIPVEDQGTLNLCVLFATNKAAETNYALTSGDYLNLSERYLDYYISEEVTGTRALQSSIANRPTLTALEAKGTPLESDFNYDDHTSAEFEAATPALRVTDSIAFPNISSSSHKSEWYQILKAHIMKYGAITADLVTPNSTTGNYNSTTNAYNYTGTDNQDHDVAIIGWDDDYAASNFTNVPGSDGAFIAVNSWGSDWGENGLFYISYESAQFLSYPFGVISTAVPAASYTTASNDKYLFSEDYVNLANHFYGVILDTNDTNEYLSHISFGLGSQNGDPVNIYLNPSEGSFDAESLILLESKNLDYSQNALTLDYPIHLTGDQFAIVFEYPEDLTNSFANRSVDTIGTTNTFLTGSMYTSDALANTWTVVDDFQFPVFAYTTSRTVSGISIVTPPTQTVFSVGQSLDLTGMSIAVSYSDGTTSKISASNLELTTSGFDSATTGAQTITVSHEGYSDTFDITVTDAEVTIAWQTLPTRRTFSLNEDLDVTGGAITATYADEDLETTVPLESNNILITGYDNTVAGTQTLTVTYLDKTLTYDVVVGVQSDDDDDDDEEEEDDEDTTADNTEMSSANEEDASSDQKISAPDTGVFSHVVVTASAAPNTIILPLLIIVFFGGLLAHDLIRRH